MNEHHLQLQPYVALAQYNQWMNRKLLSACTPLNSEKLNADQGVFFKSIIGTLNHLLITDRGWLQRLTGDKQEFRFLDSQGNPMKVQSRADVIYSSLEELAPERDRTDSRILQYIRTLETLNTSIRYRALDGNLRNHPLWAVLSHWFNHQAHHRGQITTLLSQEGLDFGCTDFIVMMEESEDPQRI